MGQAERDRRRIERLEMDRKYMEQRALEEADFPHFRDPMEHADGRKAPVEWGTCETERKLFLVFLVLTHSN